MVVENSLNWTEDYMRHHEVSLGYAGACTLHRGGGCSSNGWGGDGGGDGGGILLR